MSFFQKLHQFLHPTHFNDTQLLKMRKTHQGDLPFGSKIAIYLIYPNTGLLQSHVVALTELLRSGYTPLVVSNLPLSGQSVMQLIPICWKIIERENFGYDFGGYRDAILMLQPRFSELQRVILMNDSVWFPIPGAMDWISCAEALNVNLVGSLCIGFSGQPRAHQFRTTPESLVGTTGVFIQKTNHGGGSPFIRGLTGNQTLILIDGIRVNNSTFRYGPNQYFNTIDDHTK